jgi:hypothetical protein
MPSTDMVKVVDGPSCNCRRLGWWAEDDHEWHADQYDWKSDMAAIGARSTMTRQACKGCHPAHVHGKYSVGPKTDPSRVGKVRVQDFRQNRGEVYAFPAQSGPKLRLARVPKAPRAGHLGLRFFCVRTILFQTLHVFFVVRHANREILHAQVTRHPTADWAAQQIVGPGGTAIFDSRPG